MNAVAMITPDPKYLAMKNASFGMCMRFVLAANIGNKAPGAYVRYSLTERGYEVELGRTKE